MHALTLRPQPTVVTEDGIRVCLEMRPEGEVVLPAERRCAAEVRTGFDAAGIPAHGSIAFDGRATDAEDAGCFTFAHAGIDRRQDLGAKIDRICLHTTLSIMAQPQCQLL